jgi:endonuclease/exonuclease/phosphatase family metal-dependent hydrolase
MTDFLVAFWNVENLFAPEGHPHRLDWVEEQVRADLTGWSAPLYDRKLDQLTRIIAQMQGGQGPDILGLCEIEDDHVLRDLIAKVNAVLPGRDMGMVFATEDLSFRGIDTAFIYDQNVFSVDPDLVFNHFVMRRTGTRDILQATFKKVVGGDEIVVLANHWPSRSGGAAESAGFRATAGETLGYWHERILEMAPLKARTPVLALGDMNDDPWDGSVVFNARATRERGDVERADSGRFYNFAWEYLVTEATTHQGKQRQLDGTLYFRSNGNVFDHVMANRPLLDKKTDTPFKIVTGSAGVIAFPEMVSHKVGEGPIRFGLPKGDVAKYINQDGFSDHFPVGVMVRDS